MAKWPEPGRTKTRLAPAVGAEAASDLARAFLLDAVHTVAQADLQPVIAVSPPEAGADFAALLGAIDQITQVGTDLGARLDHVISNALARGHRPVMAINADSPTLPPSRLIEACAALERNEVDVVLGPAEDGGYYLIGVTEPPGALVTEVTMSTPDVLTDTLAIAADRGLRVRLLEPWFDVDEPCDLDRLRAELSSTSADAADTAPATRAVLADQRTIPHRVGSVAAVIPALNEEGAIAAVVRRSAAAGAETVIVVDNGSTDATAHEAGTAGAVVVTEGRRGYGYACAAGAAAASAASADVVVFLDGDGSSPPEELPALLKAVEAGNDLVLGSRTEGHIAAGAMPLHQRLGNWGSAWLMRLLFGVRVTDLGPFRAIRTEVLDSLGMEQMTYGWPTEMTVKAARAGYAVTEVPASWLPRTTGRSKVSGTLRGSVLAARYIVGTTLRYGLPVLAERARIRPRPRASSR
ncbi:MAG: TIGR04282 family arsenosugar biosynthesis glycosyltransferase [Actinomycetota bacterium]